MKQHKTVQHSFPVLLLPSCVSELSLPDQMEITLPGPTEVTLPGPTEITLPGPTEITLTNPMDVTLQGPALPTPRTVNISPQPVVLLGMVDAWPSPKIDLPGASPESSQPVDASVPAQLGALFIPVLPGDTPQFSGVLQSAPSVSESDLASHETVLPVPKLASFETTYLVPEMANSEPIYPVQSELADVVNPVPESALGLNVLGCLNMTVLCCRTQMHLRLSIFCCCQILSQSLLSCLSWPFLGACILSPS
ncbi:unnamed protein product [Oreochromis niloticus]|nr:unnamed protein product [Mustela putorius furo]